MVPAVSAEQHQGRCAILSEETGMFIKQLMGAARKRLITIGSEALLVEAAGAMSEPDAELVVVCDTDGRAVGVITKGDVVRRITHCQGSACRVASAGVMTREVVSCRPDDHVTDVWSRMMQHRLRHLPVVDDQSRPLGVVNARDVLQALLASAGNETDLLRDYVMSAGFH